MDEQDSAPQEEQQPEGAPEAPEPPSPPPGPPAGPKPEIGAYLSKAWNLVIGDPVLLIVGYLVVAAIIGFSSITIVGPIILVGPLMFGYLRVVQKRLNGEEAALGDIFAGFQDFGKALLTGVLLGAISLGVGLVTLIVVFILSLIPCIGMLLGIVVALAVSLGLGAAVYFVLPMAALSDASPTEAVGGSFRFCFAHLGWTVLLSLVTWAIGGAGNAVCLVGVFFTMPLALAMTVAAYNDYYVPNAQQAE